MSDDYTIAFYERLGDGAGVWVYRHVDGWWKFTYHHGTLVADLVDRSLSVLVAILGALGVKNEDAVFVQARAQRWRTAA